MRIIRLNQALDADTKDSIVTIGTFDGFHKGHHALVDEVVSISNAFGIPSVLVTFDPHPQSIVAPSTAPKLLTTTSEKYSLISKTDVNFMALVDFTDELRQLSAEDFLKYYIKNWLQASHMVIGYDHALGRDRISRADSIRSIAAQLGIRLTVVEPVVINSQTIKSSFIRKAMMDSKIDEINTYLGHPYQLTGKIVHGEARGQKLGFPTANLELSHHNKLIPSDGVYLVRAAIHQPADNEPFDFEEPIQYGIASIGVRPTFQPAGIRCVEIYLFDFAQDIYNSWLRVEVLSFLRSQKVFASAQELSEAMKQDEINARSLKDKYVAGIIKY